MNVPNKKRAKAKKSNEFKKIKFLKAEIEDLKEQIEEKDEAIALLDKIATKMFYQLDFLKEKMRPLMRYMKRNEEDYAYLLDLIFTNNPFGDEGKSDDK